MLLLFVYRHQDIIRRKFELNEKLDGLRRKLMDLQSYSASIADGTVSMRDLMQAPPSMFGRMSIFMQYSHQASYAGAQEKLPFMQQQLMASNPSLMQSPEMQQQYTAMIFKQLYQQEREKSSATEVKMLNQQEKLMEQEKSKMETQLKMLEAEEEKIVAAEDSGAKKSAPQYVA